MPKYVVSRLPRASPPALNVCFPRIHVKFCRTWNRFPKDAMTDPPAALKASYSALPKVSAGSVWLGVGKDGVVRVKLMDDSLVNVADGVRVRVIAALRCRSMNSTAKSRSIAVWLGFVVGPVMSSIVNRPNNRDLSEIRWSILTEN